MGCSGDWARSTAIKDDVVTLTDCFFRLLQYPFNFVLPSGHLFTYCNANGLILDYTDGTVIQARTAERLHGLVMHAGSHCWLTLP